MKPSNQVRPNGRPKIQGKQARNARPRGAAPCQVPAAGSEQLSDSITLRPTLKFNRNFWERCQAHWRTHCADDNPSFLLEEALQLWAMSEGCHPVSIKKGEWEVTASPEALAQARANGNEAKLLASYNAAEEAADGLTPEMRAYLEKQWPADAARSYEKALRLELEIVIDQTIAALEMNGSALIRWRKRAWPGENSVTYQDGVGGVAGLAANALVDAFDRFYKGSEAGVAALHSAGVQALGMLALQEELAYLSDPPADQDPYNASVNHGNYLMSQETRERLEFALEMLIAPAKAEAGRARAAFKAGSDMAAERRAA